MSGTKERREAKAGAASAQAAPASTATGPAQADNVRTRELAAMEQWGAGILAVLFSVEEAGKENRRVPQLVHAAKLFLIAVICIAPVLLMWQHAF